MSPIYRNIFELLSFYMISNIIVMFVKKYPMKKGRIIIMNSLRADEEYDFLGNPTSSIILALSLIKARGFTQAK